MEVVWCYFGKKDFDLVIDSFSLNYIDAIFNKGKENSWRWRLMGFYGASKPINIINLGTY